MSGKYVGVPADAYELPETKAHPGAQSAGLAHSASVQSVDEEGQGSRLRHSPDADGAADRADVALSMPVFLAGARKAAPVPRVLKLFQTRLARLGLAVVVLVLLLLLATGGPRSSASRLRAKLRGAAQGWGYTIAPDARILAATTPQYDDPFNPDDLTFTEEECDAYFPALWADIDRSVRYFTEHPLTKEYLEVACDEPDMTHMRVKIYNNRLYIQTYRQSDFTRTQATLALLQQSIITAREPLPNVEFCIGVQDWPGKGKFGLDRPPGVEDVWLMPDYAFLSWPEHVGTYHDLRRRIEAVERATPWAAKHPKLLWRGAMAVGTADRQAMVHAAQGYPWNDIKAVNWTTGANSLLMEDHCRWKFQAVSDGNSYTGKLRYLQNCKTVIVTHQPRWLQHWTHLFNANWDSPEQNIVVIPEPEEPPPPVALAQAPDEAVETERMWRRLPETMDALLADDARARRIAENQWNFFRNRYVSPASAACYWRKAIKGYGSVQNFTVNLAGTETSYESFITRGMRDSTWREGIQ